MHKGGFAKGGWDNGFAAVVKSYNEGKGWGFVTSPQLLQMYGKDIFFMRSSLVGGYASAGDHVSVEVAEGPRGPEATAVHVAASALAVKGGSLKGGAAPVKGSAWGTGPAGNSDTFFGVVKAFDESKGWGHISSETLRAQYGKDIFLMRSEVPEDGVSEGTNVAFKVKMGFKGPQACEVCVIPPGTVGTSEQEGRVYEGAVKTFNLEKGWGFVTSEEVQRTFGKDIFLHRVEIGEAPPPSPGDGCKFTVEVGPTGRLEAKNVQFAEPSMPGGPVQRKKVVPRAKPY